MEGNNEVLAGSPARPTVPGGDPLDPKGAARREERQPDAVPSAATVRAEDLEPHEGLRYIARLFKVLAVLMLLMMVGEVVSGIMADAGNALPVLIGEVTQMLVLAGLMWGVGDITVLLIDLGHDIRVSRILLGRINAEMHRRNSENL